MIVLSVIERPGIWCDRSQYMVVVHGNPDSGRRDEAPRNLIPNPRCPTPAGFSEDAPKRQKRGERDSFCVVLPERPFIQCAQLPTKRLGLGTRLCQSRGGSTGTGHSLPSRSPWGGVAGPAKCPGGNVREWDWRRGRSHECSSVGLNSRWAGDWLSPPVRLPSHLDQAWRA